MDYFRIASWIPIIGIFFFIVEIGPELLRCAPKLIANIAHFCTIEIPSRLELVWNDPDLFFVCVFLVRYYRLFGNVFAYFCLYEPDAIPGNPSVTAQNTHVVISTVDPGNVAFEKCITSIIKHSPKWLTIVTGGPEHRPKANEVAAKYRSRTTTIIRVCNTALPNKRRQMALALENMANENEDHKDTIVVFVDDHAWWEGENYLAHLLAPFENTAVGLVGTKKRVKRDRGQSLADSFINFLACIYLERHNFEVTATNAMDGGAFIISARTCAIRASIVMKTDFRHGFLNERFFFDTFGPLNSDDDNFITRYVVRHGWSIKFQNDGGSQNAMYTTLGVDGFAKMHGQWLRWARSLWRSHSASLFTDRSVWKRQWWTTHAALLMWFFNFAILWDGLIIWSWHHTSWEEWEWFHIITLILILRSVKLMWHFARCPMDIVFLPGYFLFAYFHAYYKLKALLTFYDTTWSGRTLRTEEPADDDNHYDDDNDFNFSGNDDSSKRSKQPASPRALDHLPSSCASAGLDVDGSVSEAPHDGEKNGSTTGITPPTAEALHMSDSESIPSGSSNSFTAEYGKNPTYTGSANRFTPWGSINTQSIRVLPANIREKQYVAYGHGSKKSYSSSARGMDRTLPAMLRQSLSFVLPATQNTPEKISKRPVPLDRYVDRAVNNSRSTHEPRDYIQAAQTQNTFDQTIVNLDCIGFDEDFLGKGASTPPFQTTSSGFPRSRSSEPHYPQLPPRSEQKRGILKSTNLLPSTPRISKTDVDTCSKSRIDTSTKTVKFSEYQREFTRGDDCHRVHGDGAYLTPPRYYNGGLRRCRSPETGV